MRLRKGELDHIVDDVSDGEGDEEAGERARAEQQRRDDELQTRQIAQVVAGGYKSRHGDKGRGKFSARDLIQDEDEEGKREDQEEEVPEEGPEMLEWLNNKMRTRKAGTSYEEEEYSDDASEFDEEKGEGNVTTDFITQIGTECIVDEDQEVELGVEEIRLREEQRRQDRIARKLLEEKAAKR